MCHLCLFFFNDTATTEIYTLSLHDALPILPEREEERARGDRRRHARSIRDGREEGSLSAPALRRPAAARRRRARDDRQAADRKSTRLNSSHANISYAVFCLKKKKYNQREIY